MGGAALQMVQDVRRQGTEVCRALDMALASMALDCLEALMPSETEPYTYLVARTMRIVSAVEGGSWAPLTQTECDVALCLRSLLAHPAAWDARDWDGRIARALMPYLRAVGLA